MRVPVRLSLLVYVVLVCAAGAHAAGSLTPLLDPYFRIQSALTDDKTEGVQADATLIATEARSLGAGGEAIAAAAAGLGAAADIGAARVAFGKLSDALIAYAEQTKAPTGEGVTAMYCPMVKKSWLQKGTAVKNPYFGKSMLTCGEKKKST